MVATFDAVAAKYNRLCPIYKIKKKLERLRVSKAHQNVERISEGAGSLGGTEVAPSEQAVFKKNNPEDMKIHFA